MSAVRFYKITPKKLRWITSHRTHWLRVGTDRWTGVSDYPASCGKVVYGEVALSTDATEVTCVWCQVDLIAQHLKNEAVEDELQALSDARGRSYK